MNRRKASKRQTGGNKETREALVARRIHNKWREACSLIGYCSRDVCVSGLQSECGWLVAGTSI